MTESRLTAADYYLYYEVHAHIHFWLQSCIIAAKIRGRCMAGHIELNACLSLFGPFLRISRG